MLNFYFGKEIVLLKKDSSKASEASLLFDLNLQHPSIYAISGPGYAAVWVCLLSVTA